MKITALTWVAVAILVTGCVSRGSVSPVSSTAVTPLADTSALVGRWQIDLSRTHMGRFGPTGHNMVRAPGFSLAFVPDGDHVRIDVYADYPQPAPTRRMAMYMDGRLHRCGDPASCQTMGGEPQDQSYIYFEVNPRLFVRRFFVKDQLTEYSTYAISADGATFTMIAWSPETPQYQNIQVFSRAP